MDEMENEDFETRDELDLENDFDELEEQEEIEDEDFDDLDEETAAAATLKPAAAPGESKAEMLSTFTQLLAQLGKEDLSNIFNQVQAQFGPNNAPGAEDKSAANRASVDMKPSAAVGKGAWKEDVDALFAGDDLSEEFRDKAETIFEAAVNTRTNLEVARLEEEFEQYAESLEEEFAEKLEEATTTIVESLTDKLDQYINYCVEQFMEENKLAIESSLRVDIAENFLTGLHNLFAEHYITVPEEKMDLVAELKAELDETKEKLSEALDEKMELASLVEEATKESVFEEISEGLAESQIEKLRNLAEGIEYTDVENYKKKVSIIKENYFTSNKTGVKSTGLITETIDGEDGTVEQPRYTAPGMEIYVEAIKKTKK